VLSALSRDEQYGLEVLRRLQDVPGLEVQEGTLYPLLSRLRLQGLVRTRLEESAEGPARKYYALTREGRRALEGMRAYVEALVAGLRRLEERDRHAGAHAGRRVELDRYFQEARASVVATGRRSRRGGGRSPPPPGGGDRLPTGRLRAGRRAARAARPVRPRSAARPR
jgi:PadR family transcriptional regulator PadR